MPTEGRRRAPQVDGDVEHRAFDHAHELALRVLDLVVQAAQHAAVRSRVVVLHELDVESCRGEARRFQLSKKKPRASPNTFGSMITTSGNALS